MPATMRTGIAVYKGKVTHRSWPQLPEELVRHIATFYLWDISAKGYCPKTWDTRESWHHRMVYTTLRDANEVEKHMMSICPQWHAALSTHLFWQQAIALIDPGDMLAHHATIHPKVLSSSAVPIRLTPYRHFRNITSCSCFVCRINLPATNIGLAIAKRYLHTPYLRTITLCREHDRRPASFCGICLRAAPVFEHVLAGAQAAAAAAHESLIGVVDNDDKDAFPNVEATCRACRVEWLWKRASESPRDREAIGGSKMLSDDWETRATVDSFIDLAEGNIRDVLCLAREKLWLRKHTRLHDMLQQALAASRFNNGQGYEGEEEEEEEEDDEEDIELMQMEESGVRDLALGDWARARILDGHWFSPADTWYGQTMPGRPTHVPAMHPCPWTRDASSFGSSPVEDEEDVHPRPSTLSAEIPPTFGLCEQAFVAHTRQMRVVLIAAMRNLVRKIVIECQTPGLGHGIEDPAIRAAKMSIEDVLTELREEEGLWFDGFDWVERRMNDRREREKKERDAAGSSTGSDDSSTSSRSSNGTSPVLSTTTLQTTPSPPPIPLGDYKEEDISSEAASTVPVMISVAPVLDPPKLLRPIPYIPITASHFPMYTMDALKMVWREACVPLYHCRCTICLRAAATNAAQGPAPPTVVPTQAPPPPPKTQPPVTIRTELLTTIKLGELDGDGEDEVELLDHEVYEEEEEEAGEVDGYEELNSSDEDGDEYEDALLATVPAPVIAIARPRKRSSDELELDEAPGDEALVGDGRETGRGGTPPKRARTGDQHEVVEESQSPRRMRKRTSEELEDAADESACKKIKMSSVLATPPSSVAEGEGEQTPPPTSPSSASVPASDG